jgi:hypothetical protein
MTTGLGVFRRIGFTRLSRHLHIARSVNKGSSIRKKDATPFRVRDRLYESGLAGNTRRAT